MLMEYEEEATVQTPTLLSDETNTFSKINKKETPSGNVKSRLARAFQVEWLGQTIASLCWIASVLAYGISSNGDWLQLIAASSWLLANIASIVTLKDD